MLAWTVLLYISIDNSSNSMAISFMVFQFFCSGKFAFTTIALERYFWNRWMWWWMIYYYLMSLPMMSTSLRRWEYFSALVASCYSVRTYMDMQTMSRFEGFVTSKTNMKHREWFLNKKKYLKTKTKFLFDK
jgi:hypothetical protein